MMHVFETLNNVQTHLITWGNPFNCNGENVIVCITGNPGVTDFYIEFASDLHKTTGLPLCVIGHAGQEEVPDKISNVLRGQEHLFNLEGQIKHKLDLINNHIDKRSKVHLIGHSIGAWIILELLHKQNDLIGRVSSVNLLFPTLQKMAQTKNGAFINLFLRKMHFLLIFLFTLAYILPESIRLFLVDIYLKFNSVSSQYSEGILKYCNPKVGEKVLFLAYDEMDSVNTLNTEIIDKIKHLTYVIYSNQDGWAPVHYMDDLRRFEPSLQMREVNIDHAFVLKSSKEVADMVSGFIKNKT